MAARRREYDIAVLGGGPAGCATALAARARGRSLRVLVVEAGDYGSDRVGESVPPDTRRLLKRLGVLEDFLREGHEPCLGSCSTWGDGVVGYNDFLLNPHGHGWHLDRRRFDAFLADQARKAGVAVEIETSFVRAVRSPDGGFDLHLAGPAGERAGVGARFVVDATGPGARLARSLGARRGSVDQLAFAIGFLGIPEGVRISRLTLLEAVEYGWWYAAKLPGGRVVAAAATAPGMLKPLGLDRPHRWVERLRATRTLATHLDGCGGLESALMIRIAPSFVLRPLTGPGWLAVGDAASAYDPLASQGIYKALADGLAAARAIERSLDGDDAGLVDYGEEVEARFEEYLAQRRYLYDLEPRWPEAPFWRQRRTRTERPRSGDGEAGAAPTSIAG